jgi:hypothetical protein
MVFLVVETGKSSKVYQQEWKERQEQEQEQDQEQ